MSLRHCVLIICLLLPVAPSYAQSWQLSGFVDPARVYTSQNPDDPAFGKPVDERRVVVSVSDENGHAVSGLKPGNFKGSVQSCDERSCVFLDLSVVGFANTPNFSEERPGFYVMKFRAKGAVQSGPVLLRVFRPATPAEIVNHQLGDRQKAQAILR